MRRMYVAAHSFGLVQNKFDHTCLYLLSLVI